MRYAITIGFRHGGGPPEVITGPEVPLAEHKAAMREIRQSPRHAEFARIEIWTSSDGRVARKRFAAPGEPASEQEGPGDEERDETEGSSTSPESSPAKAAAKKKPAKSK